MRGEELGRLALVAVAGDAADVLAVEDPAAAAGAGRHVAGNRHRRRTPEAVGEAVPAEAVGAAAAQFLPFCRGCGVAEDLEGREAGFRSRVAARAGPRGWRGPAGWCAA